MLYMLSNSNRVSLSTPNYLESIEEIKMGDVPKHKIINWKNISYLYWKNDYLEGSNAVIMEEDTLKN